MDTECRAEQKIKKKSDNHVTHTHIDGQWTRTTHFWSQFQFFFFFVAFCNTNTQKITEIYLYGTHTYIFLRETEIQFYFQSNQT